ncbi:MAG: thiolase domain-containing protein [Candidatus Bathyarchaeota archaeon]|nr:MAG: thiolase domain-containing protein [Candidatus Bathyarchaeota archaeon]
MRDVAIVGVGHSKFGNRFDLRIDELAWEAASEALKDASLSAKDMEFVVVGCSGGWSAESLPAVICSEYCGTLPKGSMRVEAACATSSAAVAVAYNLVASGYVDLVLTLGVEKMHESPNPVQIEFIGRAGNYFWEFENFGMTFPGYYALHATSYMWKHGLKEEDLAEIAVKNHHYASKNPKAQFTKEISVETVMQSRYVAWPLKLFDCCPLTDGSAALILAAEDVAKKITDTPVWINGIGAATGTGNLSRRDMHLKLEYSGLESAVYAAKQAYKQAGITYNNAAKHLDVASVHDCFTIAELMAYEDLGFCGRGEGLKLVREKQTYNGGLIPVNLDGGLKAKGHPIGATGTSMIYSLTKQLRQEYGKIGGKEAQATIRKGRAVAHNIGGTGHYAYVTVLSLEKPQSGSG